MRSRSNGRIKSYGSYERLLLRGATRVPPHRVSIPNPPYRKRASGKSCKIWIAIQRSDQKLWPLRNVTLALLYQTSSSPSIDSTSTIWRRVSGNSCKFSIAIQRSDQKLWPLRTVTLAWRDETFSTPRIDSTSTIWKKGIDRKSTRLNSSHGYISYAVFCLKK